MSRRHVNRDSSPLTCRMRPARLVTFGLMTLLALSVVCAPGAARPYYQTAVNDIGFKPDPNGFSFENYGSDSGARNLTPADVRALFGDEACAQINGDKIVLTPPARQWMEEVNSTMGNGHCEGMAALSLLFYTGEEDVTKYGADTTYDLELEDNGELQSDIARWYATQALDPTESSVIKKTPNEILGVLEQSMSKDGETYTLGIYKSDGSGGHAITPYAVQEAGNGKFKILVYDNNYPGEARAVNVDSNTNAWSYEASTNPEEESELYAGDAKTLTLELTPTSARLEQQAAPFAQLSGGPAVAGLSSQAAAARQYNQIFTEGNARLLISDEAGRRLGYVDGNLVNEIPGARYTRFKADAATGSPEPLYWLPEKMNVGVEIKGNDRTGKKPTDLMMIGPGYAVGVEGISLEAGQEDVAAFVPEDQAVTYETDNTESPTFVIAVQEQGDIGYYFGIQGTEMEGGGAITVMLDTKSKDLLLNTEKLKNEGVFNLVMSRVTKDSEQDLDADSIKLPAGAIIYMNYGDWKGPGSNVQFGVDTNGDGEIEDVYEASGESSGLPVWAWIIIGVAIVLVLGAIVVLIVVMRRRSRAKNGGAGGETPGDQH